MPGASQGFHEADAQLSSETKDLHRALVSLEEELEAIDWYRQRADATDNAALKAVLLHNMGEEIEHACMMLEWLRRHEPLFDKNLRTYLFKEQLITDIESAAEEKAADAQPSSTASRSGLTVGTLKGA